MKFRKYILMALLLMVIAGCAQKSVTYEYRNITIDLPESLVLIKSESQEDVYLLDPEDELAILSFGYMSYAEFEEMSGEKIVTPDEYGRLSYKAWDSPGGMVTSSKNILKDDKHMVIERKCYTGVNYGDTQKYYTEIIGYYPDGEEGFVIVSAMVPERLNNYKASLERTFCGKVLY